MNERVFLTRLHDEVVHAKTLPDEGDWSKEQFERLFECQKFGHVIKGYMAEDVINWEKIDTWSALKMLLVSDRHDLIKKTPLNWLINVPENIQPKYNLLENPRLCAEPSFVASTLLLPLPFYSLYIKPVRSGLRVEKSPQLTKTEQLKSFEALKNIWGVLLDEKLSPESVVQSNATDDGRITLGNLALAIVSPFAPAILAKKKNQKDILGSREEMFLSLLSGVMHLHLMVPSRQLYANQYEFPLTSPPETAHALFDGYLDILSPEPIDLLKKNCVSSSPETKVFTGTILLNSVVFGLASFLSEPRVYTKDKTLTRHQPSDPPRRISLADTPEYLKKLLKIFVSSFESLPEADQKNLSFEAFGAVFYRETHQDLSFAKSVVLRLLLDSFGQEAAKKVVSKSIIQASQGLSKEKQIGEIIKMCSLGVPRKLWDEEDLDVFLDAATSLFSSRSALVSMGMNDQKLLGGVTKLLKEGFEENLNQKTENATALFAECLHDCRQSAEGKSKAVLRWSVFKSKDVPPQAKSLKKL